MDVVRLLRQIRFFNSVAKTLLPKEKVKELKKMSKKTAIKERGDEDFSELERTPQPMESPVVAVKF